MDERPTLAYWWGVATCSIDGCGREAVSGGLCNTHYQRRRKGLDVEGPVRTSPGDGSSLTFRLPRVLQDAAARDAETEGVQVPEWWRRAGAERLERRKGAPPPPPAATPPAEPAPPRPDPAEVEARILAAIQAAPSLGDLFAVSRVEVLRGLDAEAQLRLLRAREERRRYLSGAP